MRLAIGLNGSRGDVQPGLAVAIEMSRRGHEVAVGVPENLVDFAGACGVDAIAFAPDTDELLRSPLIKQDLKSRDPRTRIRAVRDVTEFGSITMDDRLLEISEGADLVVTGLMGQERGATVAEHRGAVFVPLHYCPIRPSRSVPLPLGPLSVLSAVPMLTEATWRAVDLAFWLGSARRGDEVLRRRLGMQTATGTLGTRLRRAGTPEIQAYDPGLFPALSAEWGAQRPMTGFISLPDRAGRGVDSDDDVMAWVESGAPPVYVGFGSMPLTDPTTSYRILVEVIRAQDRRVLLCAGPNSDVAGTLFADDPGVLVVRAVDHDTVLPRCAAAVHHGGAGTTGACARAGIPTLITAFSADQPIWGRATADAGLGSTCSIKAISDREKILSEICRILRPEFTHRTHSFARAMIDPRDTIHAIAEILEKSV